MEFEGVQVDPVTHQATLVHTENGVVTSPPKNPVYIPISGTMAEHHSTFKSVNRASAGTTIITSPDTGGSVQVYDLLVSADKVNAATATIRFTDGSNTINMMTITTTDAPANFAVPLRGRWQGWKDARLELVTVNGVDCTVAVSYMKVDESLGFTEWDSFR